MKITKSQLKKIIKEELGRVLREDRPAYAGGRKKFVPSDVEQYEWMKEDYPNIYKYVIAVEYKQPIATELKPAAKKEFEALEGAYDGLYIDRDDKPSNIHSLPYGEYSERFRRADQLYALYSDFR